MQAATTRCIMADPLTQEEREAALTPHQRRETEERAAQSLYERHVHTDSCDCEFPTWCLFEAGFKDGERAAEARVAEARSSLRFIGTSPWTESDHPSAAYARSALASLAGEDDEPRA